MAVPVPDPGKKIDYYQLTNSTDCIIRVKILNDSTYAPDRFNPTELRKVIDDLEMIFKATSEQYARDLIIKG